MMKMNKHQARKAAYKKYKSTQKKATGRQCKGCGRCLDHKHINARFCGKICKDDYWNRENPRGYGLKVYEALDDDMSWDAHKNDI